MSTADVAKKLVEFCRKGEFMQAVEQLYSKDIVSVEAMEMPNMPRTIRGIEAVKGKNEWFMSNHTIHKAAVEGPFVSPEKFAVVYDMDVTMKQTGKRSQMKEAAVYTVADGKIVHEEFLYGS